MLPISKRDLRIVEMRDRGLSYQAIGDRVKLSRQRVQQILARIDGTAPPPSEAPKPIRPRPPRMRTADTIVRTREEWWDYTLAELLRDESERRGHTQADVAWMAGVGISATPSRWFNGLTVPDGKSAESEQHTRSLIDYLRLPDIDAWMRVRLNSERAIRRQRRRAVKRRRAV